MSNQSIEKDIEAQIDISINPLPLIEKVEMNNIITIQPLKESDDDDDDLFDESFFIDSDDNTNRDDECLEICIAKTPTVCLCPIILHIMCYDACYKDRSVEDKIFCVVLNGLITCLVLYTFCLVIFI